MEKKLSRLENIPPSLLEDVPCTIEGDYLDENLDREPEIKATRAKKSRVRLNGLTLMGAGTMSTWTGPFFFYETWQKTTAESATSTNGTLGNLYATASKACNQNGSAQTLCVPKHMIDTANTQHYSNAASIVAGGTATILAGFLVTLAFRKAGKLLEETKRLEKEEKKLRDERDIIRYTAKVLADNKQRIITFTL